MFADQHQDWRRDLSKLGPEVERSQRNAGGAEYFRVGSQKCFTTIAHQVGMFFLKFWRKQPAHRDVGDRCQSLGFGSRSHIAKSFAAGLGKRSPAIRED